MDNNKYFKGLTRKEYIQRVHGIIERDGCNDISIRKIAEELGCSSAALYRYFENKSELLYYVNLQTLESYIIRLNQEEKHWNNPWEVYVGVWDCYCKEAFSHPKEYNRLFFEHTNETLNYAIREYYEMFPENIKEMNLKFQEMLNTPDFLGRDYKMCLRCVEAGVLSEENAKQLNRSVCMLFKGYFKTVYDEKIEKHKIDAMTRDVIGDIDMIVRALASDLQGYHGYYE
ncbi:MAG: TetR/AcrR family transcriptional regulator [Dorea sp.]|nr:TetR/AcrR family transcriptional regulator [Dorea sp.]